MSTCVHHCSRPRLSIIFTTPVTTRGAVTEIAFEYIVCYDDMFSEPRKTAKLKPIVLVPYIPYTRSLSMPHHLYPDLYRYLGLLELTALAADATS